MSPGSAEFKRTSGRIVSLFSTAVAAGVFFAVCGVLFAFNVQSAEGRNLAAASVWCMSVSPVLPFLAAVLGMSVWSEEFSSGRIDVLLSSPVRVSRLVLARFQSVFLLTFAMAAGFWAVCAAVSAATAPALAASFVSVSFIPAFVAVAVQSVLWCAVSVASSAMFSNAAVAAAVSAAVCAGLPRFLWSAALCLGSGAAGFVGMPLDTVAYDMSCGDFSVGALVCVALFSWAALFAATKRIAAHNFAGAAGRGARAAAAFSCVLAFVFAGLAVSLAFRLDTTLELRHFRGGGGFSVRTRRVLEETRGEIEATIFMERRDPSFRPVARFLRALATEAEAAGGAGLKIRVVDPKWDAVAAAGLKSSGVEPGSVVFSRGPRTESLKVSDGFGERAAISSIVNVAMPRSRKNVYWCTGHGEGDFESSGDGGSGDLASDLLREGCRNQRLDLASISHVPSDAAFVVVAAPKEDYSRAETGVLEAYMRQGGRLLVLVSDASLRGISTLLSAWGARLAPGPAASPSSLSGGVLADVSPDHPVTAPLAGSRIVLGKTASISPSAAAGGTSPDAISFRPLAFAGGACVAAALEKGSSAGSDLSFRPARIIVVGDGTVAMNGPLSMRANANRDFLLNCAAYLSGTGAIAGSGMESGTFSSGLDREGFVRFAVASAAPGAVVFLVFAALAARRRRRS